MPELPEVETVARGLRQAIQGLRLIDISTPQQLTKHALGKTIQAIERRGKWLVLRLDNNYGFVIHLKMTGQLLYQPKTTRQHAQFLGGHTMVSDERHHNVDLPNKHTRVIFTFHNGARLFFQDMRKFGYVELYNPAELATYFIKKKLGIEPLDPAFTIQYWHKQLQRHPATSLKAVLLNQSIVAGIGNIYADDICWTAKVRPTRRVRSLSVPERQALYRAIKKIIQQAIALGGTSFSHYYRVDGTLGQYWQKRKVYGRTGQLCRRQHCRRQQATIVKTRCAGRGTHYCPRCQK